MQVSEEPSGRHGIVLRIEAHDGRPTGVGRAMSSRMRIAERSPAPLGPSSPEHFARLHREADAIARERAANVSLGETVNLNHEHA